MVQVVIPLAASAIALLRLIAGMWKSPVSENLNALDQPAVSLRLLDFPYGALPRCQSFCPTGFLPMSASLTKISSSCRQTERTQDIRPLRILALNLMPTKITTETQIARLLANSPLQVELTLLQTASHRGRHVSGDHLDAFYKTFDDIEDERLTA